ncbi:MAG TPA: damage-inducible protein [Pseudolabrys sp.]
MTKEALLRDLRLRIATLEHGGDHRSILALGIPAIDRALPGGGLPRGALHECAGGGLGAVHGAAAALFVAGVLGRLKGQVFWCLRARDLFAPALAGAGLPPDRVIYAEASDDKTVLLCMEEGLRHKGLAGVVGEVARLPVTASRRLQLAAETSGVTAFVIRRWRVATEAAQFNQPSAAATRWRITAAPSAPLTVPGIGRPRWKLELLRCRGGDSAEWDVEVCDETGHLALSAELADGSAAAEERHHLSA